MCFKVAEIDNLALIMFITLKVNFNQGGFKWSEPERARTMAGKCIECLQKVQAKFYYICPSALPVPTLVQ